MGFIMTTSYMHIVCFGFAFPFPPLPISPDPLSLLKGSSQLPFHLSLFKTDLIYFLNRSFEICVMPSLHLESFLAPLHPQDEAWTLKPA